jgi:hypothetical protein
MISFQPNLPTQKRKSAGALRCSPARKTSMSRNDLSGRASCTSCLQIDAIGLQAWRTEPLIRAGRRFYI